MSKYGRMDRPLRKSIAELYPVEGCTLGNYRAIMCTGEVCARCGWNKDEAARRRRLIERNGLTVNPETGLKQLSVPRRGSL